MLGAGKRWLVGLVVGLAALGAGQRASATSGGDATLRILGWDAERQSILVWRAPGGENSIVELWAINLAEKRVDLATCDTCAELQSGDAPRDAAERAYLAVMREASKLVPLRPVAREQWHESGVYFACSSRARRFEESDFWYRQQTCRLHVRGAPATTLEFSAKSEWHVPRLFRAPGHPEFLLAWVTHTGIVEFGYREEELAWTPRYVRRAVSLSTFAHTYAPGR